jgi:Protein of unknown function (DUF1579)
MRRVSTITILLTLLFAVAVCAQAQMPAATPGPELKKLAFLAGNWAMDGDLKSGPMGPGGKVTGTEQIEWMEGGFFLVSHSTFKGAGMGNGTGISFYGYDPNEKVYTYDEFNSMGEAEHSKGTVDGDTWTWTSDEKMGGMTMKGRFTMKILSPTSYSFKFDMSQDGTTWTAVMDGKSTKN